MDSSRFSNWRAWRERDSLEGLNWPGVYAIAISKKNLANERFQLSEDIVYFGMTNAATGLKGRLKQFDNTLNDKPGHGGAERLRYDYQDADAVAKLLGSLYVAVAPFECKVTSNEAHDLLIMGDVAKAEYECFALFAGRFGELPRYNNKKSSPKR